MPKWVPDRAMSTVPGDQRLDDQVRRHVGRLDVEIFFGKESLFLGHNIIDVERRRIVEDSR